MRLLSPSRRLAHAERARLDVEEVERQKRDGYHPTPGMDTVRVTSYVDIWWGQYAVYMDWAEDFEQQPTKETP